MTNQYYIETYGCQMNVADSQLVAGVLNDEQYTRTEDIADAQIILLNTCAIREKAEETVQNRLDGLAYLKRKDPSVLIGVIGCMAQNLADTLLETRPFVDIILGPDSYRRLPQIIKERQSGSDHVVDTRLSRHEVYEELFPAREAGLNAWISIMRGCDKFCTFCVVPYTRGRERSRSIESVVTEATDAVRNGFVEVTLLGQNVNSFNHDGQRFPELLEAVASIEGVRRIRFTSPHPSDVDVRMLEVMAAHTNICDSIHLPLQAGADRVLNRMQRTYTQAEFLSLVNRIRTYLPKVGLTTDIIVGFPGETAEEFEETLKVMEKVQFDSAFMFKYSLRPGTKAAEYSDHIDEAEKQRRLEAVIALQRESSIARNQNQIGKVVEVLVERESKKSELQWAGRTDTNKLAVFDQEDSQIGDFVQIKIDSARGITLQGHIVSPVENYHAVA